jgi:hypothetical protein
MKEDNRPRAHFINALGAEIIRFKKTPAKKTDPAFHWAGISAGAMAMGRPLFAVPSLIVAAVIGNRDARRAGYIAGLRKVQDCAQSNGPAKRFWDYAGRTAAKAGGYVAGSIFTGLAGVTVELRNETDSTRMKTGAALLLVTSVAAWIKGSGPMAEVRAIGFAKHTADHLQYKEFFENYSTPVLSALARISRKFGVAATRKEQTPPAEKKKPAPKPPQHGQ